MPGRIRAGIVGMGFMGQVHARAIRAAGGEVAAVADATPAGAERAAGLVGGDCRADSLEGLLKAADLSATPDLQARKEGNTTCIRRRQRGRLCCQRS